MGKKLLCLTFTSNSIHIAAALEIISEIHKGYTQTEFAWMGHKTLYPSRMARNLDGLKFASRKNFFTKYLDLIPNLNYQYSETLTFDSSIFWHYKNSFAKQLNKCKTLEDLLNLNHDGIKPGSALINTLVNELQQDKINLKQNHKIILMLINSYLQVYLTVKYRIQNKSNVELLIYNGRFLHERAVWDCAKFYNNKVMLYETLRNRFITRNFGFHDRVLNQKEMKFLWNNSKLPEVEKEKAASEYFHDLASTKNNFSTSASLPIALTSKKYIVFFTNTDYEAIGFWESWKKPFLSQIELVRTIQKQLKTIDDIIFVVRLHPNLKKQSKNQKSQWDFLKRQPDIILIDENSKISSIELIKNSIAVFSFGSTVGLQAAYHEKPSFIFADCWYDQLGAAMKIENTKNLSHLLKSLSELKIDLKKAKRGALIRGFWFSKAGSEFKLSLLKEKSWGSWEVINFSEVSMIQNDLILTFHKVVNALKRKRSGLKA